MKEVMSFHNGQYWILHAVCENFLIFFPLLLTKTDWSLLYNFVSLTVYSRTHMLLLKVKVFRHCLLVMLDELYVTVTGKFIRSQ